MPVTNASAGTGSTREYPVTDSLWAHTATPRVDYPPLQSTVNADVAIVGGGFTGLSCALHLAEAGVQSVVLEAVEPGWGASGRNGGMLIPAMKITPAQLGTLLGPEAGRKAAEFSVRSTDVVMDIVQRYAIDCHADLGGWLVPAHSPRARARLETFAREWHEVQACIEMLDAAQMQARLGSSAYHGGFRHSKGGKLHPLSYARGLARAAATAGARICAHSEVTELQRTQGRWRVVTASGVVRAERVLIATNGYTGDLWPGLRQTVIPAHSFLVATTPLSDNLRSSILPGGDAASDSRRLLLYFRMDHQGRLLLGGRGSVAEPTGAQAFAGLRAQIKALYPQLGEVEFEHHWFGRICITLDKVPHLHQPAPGLTTALGYNGRGVAMATAMGSALANYFVRGDAAELPFPLRTAKKIPLHGIRNQISAATIAYYRVRDLLETL
ncbi:MAG: FAD-binding oxidoreductase [Gammaproteobacteria bacterium]|nr:FAD-binding oxidoreductase [Gammaproteobacteria bacterium]